MDIKDILSYALSAPSGDNCQPWRFAVAGNVVHLYNEPSADESLYNFSQNASFVALGALIENIMIAAAQNGFDVTLELFLQNDPNHVAALSFNPAQRREQALYPYLPKRSTNRRLYDGTPLSKDELAALAQAAGDNGFRIVTGPAAVNEAARAASRNEKLVLGNFYLHKFLFQHVRWSDKEAAARKDGLFIKTLEMKKPEQIIFKLASSWRRMKLLNKVGLGKKIASESQKNYASSSGFGAFVRGADPAPEDFLTTGRALQRVWLRATAMGLSMHPLTGIVFLKSRVRQGGGEVFSSYELKTIEDAYQALAGVFNVGGNEMMTFMFRIGRAPAPSATSPHLALEQVMRT